MSFAVEGLTVTNAAVKQTDSSVVVLTTSAQEVGKTYTVTESGAVVGSFVGAETVIPTGIKTTVGSYQGVLGKEVTLKAEVTVADGKSKAGIPVTFNIVDENDNTKNDKIEVEVFTNADGVAEYSYTRYYDGVDEVVAYATDKSSVSSDAKVYWDDKVQLTVKADQEKLEVANGDSVSYDIKGEADSVVYVAFKENLNVKIDEVVEDVIVKDADGESTFVYDKDENTLLDVDAVEDDLYPYEVDSKDYRLVVIELDGNGEGSFTLTGDDASVTPIVYTFDQEYDDLLDKNDDLVFGELERYDRTALQAVAETVTFKAADSLKIDVEAVASNNAAGFDKDLWEDELAALTNNADHSGDINTLLDGKKFNYDKQPANLGGRDYVATIKDEDGDTVGKGFDVHVFVDEDHIKEDVYLIDVNGKVWDMDNEEAAILEADKDGKVKFTLVGKSTGYATPTVFIDEDDDNELDKKEARTEGERVYFKAPSIKNAGLKIYDAEGDEVSSVSANQAATFSYISVDQNGKQYFDEAKDFVATFSVSAKTTDATVYLPDGSSEEVTAGRTKTFTVDSSMVNDLDGEGVASINVVADTKGSVTVKASSTSPSLGQVSKTLKVVGESEVGDTFSGDVVAINQTRSTITFADNNGDKKDPVKYDRTDDEFYNDVTDETIRGAKFEDLVEDALNQNRKVKVKYEKGENGNKWTIVSIGGVVSGPATGVTQSVVDAVNVIEENSGGVTQTKLALRAISKFAALSDADQTTVATAINGSGVFANIKALEDALQAQYDLLDAAAFAALVADVKVAADYTALVAAVKAVEGADAAVTALNDVPTGIRAAVLSKVNGYTFTATNAGKLVDEIKAIIAAEVRDADDQALVTALDAVANAAARADVISALKTHKSVLDIDLTTLTQAQLESAADYFVANGKASYTNLTQFKADYALATDFIAPTVKSAVIDTVAGTITLTFSEAVSLGTIDEDADLVAEGLGGTSVSLGTTSDSTTALAIAAGSKANELVITLGDTANVAAGNFIVTIDNVTDIRGNAVTISDRVEITE